MILTSLEDKLIKNSSCSAKQKGFRKKRERFVKRFTLQVRISKNLRNRRKFFMAKEIVSFKIFSLWRIFAWKPRAELTLLKIS